MEEKQTKLEIYFKDGFGLKSITADPKNISALEIRNGLLKIYDKQSEGWHCYNMDIVSHIHYPIF